MLVLVLNCGAGVFRPHNAEPLSKLLTFCNALDHAEESFELNEIKVGRDYYWGLPPPLGAKSDLLF